jgi:membrane associated rhomboid family serine protease
MLTPTGDPEENAGMEDSGGLEKLGADRADLLRLVLASQGIRCGVEADTCRVAPGEVPGETPGKPGPGMADLEEERRETPVYRLVLDPSERARAQEIIDAYDRENRDFPERGSEVPVLPLQPLGCTMAAALLVGIHAWCLWRGVHGDMVHRFGSSALHILQGEIWRAFTALFFHADPGHLAGNLAGLLLFGVPLCSAVGSRTGFLILAGSGFTGNLATAMMYRNAHLAIGASTSVMGAAGALAALQVRRRFRLRGLRPGILVPLGAGAALLGMLSGGERTDVAAHGFGFVAGFILGMLVPLDSGNRPGGRSASP